MFDLQIAFPLPFMLVQQGKESSILRLKKRVFDRAFKNVVKVFSGTWQKSRGFCIFWLNLNTHTDPI